MADTLYAWSPILLDAEVDEKTGVIGKTKRVEMGESVTKAKLGVDDANFAAMVEAGVLRPYKVPEMPENFQGSVVDHLRDEARKASSDVGEAAFSLGGSYFGPSPEQALMDPSSVGVEEADAEEVKGK